MLSCLAKLVFRFGLVFLAAFALRANSMTPGVLEWDGDVVASTSYDDGMSFNYPNYDDPNGMLVTDSTANLFLYNSYFYQADREFTVLTAGWFTETNTLNIDGSGSTELPDGTIQFESPSDPYGLGIVSWNGGSQTVAANYSYYVGISETMSSNFTEYLAVGTYDIYQDLDLNSTMYDSDVGSSFLTTVTPIPEPCSIAFLAGFMLLAGAMFRRAKC